MELILTVTCSSFVVQWFVPDAGTALVIIHKDIIGLYAKLLMMSENFTFVVQEIVSLSLMTDYADRKGDYITTYTGRQFYPFDPRPEDINIEDIAHSLSLINRFTGHSKFPYSVAQHSLAVGWQTYNFHKYSSLSGLMHDAAEAYINDLSTQLKRELPDYKSIENKILDVIDAKYCISTRSETVKSVDTRALVTEAQELLNGYQWYLEPEWPLPFNYPVLERNWRDVEIEFLQTFELFGGHFE